MNVWWTAFIWIALALAASLISIRLALSVALMEILFGVLGGNVLNIQPNEWINFLAGLGGVLLTFLAGAEIEPQALRQYAKSALSIALASFLPSLLGTLALVYWGARWDLRAGITAAIAMSPTSIAVVYTVMVETGLNRTSLGKRIIVACFLANLLAMLALGILTARGTWWLAVFLLAIIATFLAVPHLARAFFQRTGEHLSEPQIKLVASLLLLLSALAVQAKSEPVLGAYLLGLALSGVLVSIPGLLHRIRTLSFTMFTPFYFLKAGTYVSLPVAWQASGWIALLLACRMLTKMVVLYPVCRLQGICHRESMYTTLLMATGLTFDIIVSLFGLSQGFINHQQYTMLVAVIIASAIVPTVVAQTFFRPAMPSEPRATLPQPLVKQSSS